MHEPLLVLRRGDSLNAFEVSAETALPFPGTPAVAEDVQDYRYVNGFVDVGDLPCRTAIWAETATRTVALQDDWTAESLYLPGPNRRVEFSQFRHVPTRLSRWCRTRLVAQRDRYCSFRLSTRGGVHIWVDGVLAARFEPYTRNETCQSVVHLPLRQAGSRVVVLTEDMAERDTNWFFELTLIDDVVLAVDLPGADRGEGLAALSALAAEVRPEGGVVSKGGRFALIFDDPAPVDVDIDVQLSATSHTRAAGFQRRLTLGAGETLIEVAPAEALADGYHDVHLTFSAQGSRVKRSIAIAVLADPVPRQLPGALAERKRLALEHAATAGEMRMGTAVALFETGRADDPRLRPILVETLDAIEERRDCADFVAVPLLWAFKRHRDAFPPDLAARTETALQGFRYWVDEPGNDVMWFWSENHALCFHAAQLLAGQIWPEARFSASGRSGAEQAALGLERLSRWFDAVEEDGLAEWNSAAYYPIDLIGLLALTELAPQPIAGRAERLCDHIFAMVALHTLGGVPAGSMGRAYDKELRAGPLTELAPIAAVAFGTGWLNAGVAAMPFFAAGSYEPPPRLAGLAAPVPGSPVEARYRQGFGPAALLTLYKTDAVQLSTNGGARAGGYGHQQHVLDLLFSAHPMARAWINHPGEDDPYGKQRPSYWAGNGTLPRVGQYRGTALVFYRLGPEARLAFTHLHASRNGVDHDLVAPDTLVLRAGRGRVAIKATGPLVPVATGPSAGIEYRLDGRINGWAVIVDESGSDPAFLKTLSSMELGLGDGGSSLTLAGGGVPALALDWSGGLTIDGKIENTGDLPAFPSV